MYLPINPSTSTINSDTNEEVSNSPVQDPVKKWPSYLLGTLILFFLLILLIVNASRVILAVSAMFPALVIILIYQFRSEARRNSVSIHDCSRMALYGAFGTGVYLVGQLVVLNKFVHLYLGIIPLLICLGALKCFYREAPVSQFDKYYLIGLGSWNLSPQSGNRIYFVVGFLFTAFCVFLGSLAAYFQTASFSIIGYYWIGEIPTQNSTTPSDQGRDIGGTFVMAYFAAAFNEETFKYSLVCIARSLSNANGQHFANSVLVLTLWGVLGFATIENLMYVGAGGIGVGIVRALSAVPCHCFTALIIALGVIQTYTVKNQSRKKALGILVLHLFVAMALHGTYDWMAMMVSRPSISGISVSDSTISNLDVVVILIVILLSVCCCANPGCYQCLLQNMKSRTAKSLGLNNVEQHSSELNSDNGQHYRCSNCQLLLIAPQNVTQFQCPQCKFILSIQPATAMAVKEKESIETGNKMESTL